MNKEEYYKISKEKELPLRCPILNYCSRRAWTIYLFSDYSKIYPNLTLVNALNMDGVLPMDFNENKLQYQGEDPYCIKGSDSFFFSDVCPEVNLFDGANALISGKACSQGKFDQHYKGEKKVVLESKHFSECAEFNKYLFDSNKISKQIKKTKRKAIPYKIKAILQSEIKSKCPFCDSTDVGHFQIHHIDENPINNSFDNLLMLCPNCHSKITKGDINLEQVIYCKRKLNE